MRTLLKDIRYAARVLRKSKGFTAVAIIAIALGVGANTAIFSVVNAVLLRPLSYKDPSQLVLIQHHYPKLDLKATVSASGYAYYRDNVKSFSDVAAITGFSVNLTGEGEPERPGGEGGAHLPRRGEPGGAQQGRRPERRLLAPPLRRAAGRRQDDHAQRRALHGRRRDAGHLPARARVRRPAARPLGAHHLHAA